MVQMSLYAGQEQRRGRHVNQVGEGEGEMN